MLHDNVGEHISKKNKEFCELTAQYWVWKNEEADYYGFFHYRRYLNPNIKERKVYTLFPSPEEKVFRKIGFNRFEEIIPQYEIILPKQENMHISVEEHYKKAPFHHKEDFDLMKLILISEYPEYEKAMTDYFSNTNCYFGNIFIMKKERFFDYCDWLFSILFLYEEKSNNSNYSCQDKRVVGYLGERLLGVYFTYWKEKVNYLELSRVHFENNTMVRMKKKCETLFFPAGSKRRAWVKCQFRNLVK